MRFLVLLAVLAPTVRAQGSAVVVREVPLLPDTEWVLNGESVPTSDGVEVGDAAGYFRLALPPGWSGPVSSEVGTVTVVSSDSAVVELHYAPGGDEPVANGMITAGLNLVTREALGLANVMMRQGTPGSEIDLGPVLLREVGGRRMISQSVSVSDDACRAEPACGCRATMFSFMPLPDGAFWIRSRSGTSGSWEGVDQVVGGVTVRDRSETCEAGLDVAAGLRLDPPPEWTVGRRVALGGLAGVSLQRADSVSSDTVTVVARLTTQKEQDAGIEALADVLLSNVTRKSETALEWQEWKRVQGTPNAVYRKVETRQRGADGLVTLGADALVFVVRAGPGVAVGTVRNGGRGASYRAHVVEAFAWRLAACGPANE